MRSHCKAVIFKGLGKFPTSKKCLCIYKGTACHILSGIPDNTYYTESGIMPNLLENLDFTRGIIKIYGITFS